MLQRLSSLSDKYIYIIIAVFYFFSITYAYNHGKKIERGEVSKEYLNKIKKSDAERKQTEKKYNEVTRKGQALREKLKDAIDEYNKEVMKNVQSAITSNTVVDCFPKSWMHEYNTFIKKVPNGEPRKTGIPSAASGTWRHREHSDSSNSERKYYQVISELT